MPTNAFSSARSAGALTGTSRAHWAVVRGQVTPIVSSRLLLQPVTSEIALAVVSGRTSDIPVGAGWPHEDTADAMAMALLPEAGPSWLITLDGIAIGDCGAFSWPDASGTVEIGYGLAEPYRRSGYGTEAAEAMCGWLLTEAGATAITANGVEADNLASRRVLEKLGFSHVGEEDGRGSYRLERESPEGRIAASDAPT